MQGTHPNLAGSSDPGAKIDRQGRYSEHPAHNKPGTHTTHQRAHPKPQLTHARLQVGSCARQMNRTTTARHDRNPTNEAHGDPIFFASSNRRDRRREKERPDLRRTVWKLLSTCCLSSSRLTCPRLAASAAASWSCRASPAAPKHGQNARRGRARCWSVAAVEYPPSDDCSPITDVWASSPRRFGSESHGELADRAPSPVCGMNGRVFV